MDAIVTTFLQQGPLGLIAGLFIFLYMQERTKNTELQTKINEIQQHNYATLDHVRESQIKREQEVAGTFEEYGKGVIEAVHHATLVAEELRRLHAGRNKT